MPASCGVLSLPKETIDAICDTMGREDLINIRLSCRHLSPSAERALYRHVYLKSNTETFTRLRLIADDPRLSQLVQFIHYSSLLLGGKPYPQGKPLDYQQWKEECVGQGLKYATFAIQDSCEGLSEHKLKISYENYCKVILSQYRHDCAGTEAGDLIHAIKRFPQLKGISLSNVIDSARYGGTVNMRQMSRTAQATLMEPIIGLGSTGYGKQLETLVFAADMAKNSLAQFQVTQLPAECLLQEGIFKTMCHGLRRCRKLILGMDIDFRTWPDEWEEAKATRLGAMMNCTPLLETLSLSFRLSAFNNFWLHYYLPSIIPRKIRWSMLSSLKLSGVTTSQEHLCHLLSSHASTLTSLEIGHINLMPPKHPQSDHENLEEDDSEERDHNENEFPGSWISIILFLHNKLNLTTVRFGGILSNLRDEAWFFKDPEEYSWIDLERQPKGICLKHQVSDMLFTSKSLQSFPTVLAISHKVQKRCHDSGTRHKNAGRMGLLMHVSELSCITARTQGEGHESRGFPLNSRPARV